MLILIFLYIHYVYLHIKMYMYKNYSVHDINNNILILMLRPPLEYYSLVCFIKVQAAKVSEKDIKIDQSFRKPGF